MKLFQEERREGKNPKRQAKKEYELSPAVYLDFADDLQEFQMFL